MCAGHFDANPCFPVAFLCSHLFYIVAESITELSGVSLPYIRHYKENINRKNQRHLVTIEDLVFDAQTLWMTNIYGLDVNYTTTYNPNHKDRPIYETEFKSNFDCTEKHDTATVNIKYAYKWRDSINTLHIFWGRIDNYLAQNVFDQQQYKHFLYELGLYHLVWKQWNIQIFKKNQRQNQGRFFWFSCKLRPPANFWHAWLFCLSNIILNNWNKWGKKLKAHKPLLHTPLYFLASICQTNKQLVNKHKLSMDKHSN